MASVTEPCTSFRTTDCPTQLTRIFNGFCHRILLPVTRITSRGTRILDPTRTIIDCKRKRKRSRNRNRQRRNNFDISIWEIVRYRRYRVSLKTSIMLRHCLPVPSVTLYHLVPPRPSLIPGSRPSRRRVQSRYRPPNRPCTFICIIISNRTTFAFPASRSPRFLIPPITRCSSIITRNISIIRIIDTITSLPSIVYHRPYPLRP